MNRAAARATAATLAALAGSLGPSFASGAVDVCGASCAPTDAACNARVMLCESGITAFDIYMDNLAAGFPEYELPAIYREILQPHYPGADLAAVRFAFSDRQPPDNATTDCNRIFFSSQSYVDALRNADPNPKLLWILHELTHPEQCAAAGGRTGYAKRWWDELQAAIRERGEGLNLLQTPEQLAKQIEALYFEVHDAMPMEQDAESKARAVLGDLRRCCVAADGRPIRPLALGAIEERLEGGGPERVLFVEAEGGDAPLVATWRIRGPGDAQPVEQPTSRARGLELSWTPELDPAIAEVVDGPAGRELRWSFEVEVEVAQESPDLEPQRAARTITVVEARAPSGS